jgi:hypothetical protein
MLSTRRELIRGGAVSAAAVAAGAPSAANAADPLAGASGDRELLSRLTSIEQLIAFAYAHLLKAGGVSAATAKVFRTFYLQENAHVRLLSGALAHRGSAPSAPPTDVKRASRQLAHLGAGGSLRDSRGDAVCVRYMIGVETVAEGAYYSAMSKLSDATLLIEAAQVMSCEAQHWTALSGLQHAGDVFLGVPYPTVTGAAVS